MELRHLRYFVAVAEDRHFGRAARRLQIAQPPLSRSIQALEAELGAQLFVRGTRRVDLTPAGDALLVHARRVFDEVELGTRAARRAAAGQVGRIAIGYPSSLAYTGLTDVLRAFRDRAPAVEVALRELPPQSQIEALLDRSIDVGFVRSTIDDAAIVTERVRREPLLVALPADHPLASKKRIALSALARESFVLFPRARGTSFFDYLMRLCHDAGFTPRIVQEAAQLDIVALVAAGFGVSLLPASAREVQREGLVLRPIVGSPYTELFVAWRADNPSPVVRDFVETVRSVGLTKPRAPASGYSD
jgi:DNA-binding transcriptional LysR family regulator